MMNPKLITRRLNAKTKSFLLAAVAVSLTMWNLSFNLGAFGTIFFENIFAAWITASATFLGCLLLPPSQSPVDHRGLTIMAIPTVGFIFTFIENNTANSFLDLLGIAISIVSYVFCLPYTIFIIFSITQADIVKLSRKMTIKLISIAAIIGFLGYFIGSHNYLFLSCDDFTVSGNDIPANCRHTSQANTLLFSVRSP